MLKIAGDLTSYALSAGEPFLMQVQLATAAGLAMDIADQSLVLTFYKPSSREIVVQLEGQRDEDATGEFFRFERDGSFSEDLYGQFLRVELARRYQHGRSVLADGALAVAASAASVPSLAGAAIGELTLRVTIRAAAQLGGAALVSVNAHPFLPGADIDNTLGSSTLLARNVLGLPDAVTQLAVAQDALATRLSALHV